MMLFVQKEEQQSKTNDKRPFEKPLCTVELFFETLKKFLNINFRPTSAAVRVRRAEGNLSVLENVGRYLDEEGVQLALVPLVEGFRHLVVAHAQHVLHDVISFADQLEQSGH